MTNIIIPNKSSFIVLFNFIFDEDNKDFYSALNGSQMNPKSSARAYNSLLCASSTTLERFKWVSEAFQGKGDDGFKKFCISKSFTSFDFCARI